MDGCKIHSGYARAGSLPARYYYFLHFFTLKSGQRSGNNGMEKRANVATAEFVFSHLQKCGKHSNTVTMHNVHAVLTEQLLA